ncbi:MAG: hypothetical protein SGBAC_011032 [Bacillariaceae sp.]
MQIRRGRKRQRSQLQANNNNGVIVTRLKILLGFGVFMLVLPYFMDDEQYYAMEHHSPFSFHSSPLQQRQWKTKLIFDFDVGPAVEKAKYFGFANRDSNQGHNRSDWDLLAVQTCDANDENAMLSESEIYKRKLPTAILLGVQKGGTTALSKYLFKHEDIEPTDKELYVLDEALDNHLFHQEERQQQAAAAVAARGANENNNAAMRTVSNTPILAVIPRKRGRDLYSQMTLGITQKLARRFKNEELNGLSSSLHDSGSGNGGGGGGKKGTRTADASATTTTTRTTTNMTTTPMMMTPEMKERLDKMKKEHETFGSRLRNPKINVRVPRGQRSSVHRKRGGPHQRQLLEEEEQQQQRQNAEHSPREDGGDLGTTADDASLAQKEKTPVPRKASPPSKPSWDPDEKMKRYFQRRKTSLAQNPISESKRIVLDMTPNYMFHSDRVPARIECLVPWVKLFVILRDPIDRAISQYDMKMRVVQNGKFFVTSKRNNKDSILQNSWGNPVPSLDQYILNDLEALTEVGVVQDWTTINFETFWASTECWQAWQKYIHLGLNAPIGMGIYALQIKPFLDMLEKVHHTNSTNDDDTTAAVVKKNYFMALDNHDLRNNPDETYNRLLKFLNLEPKSLRQYRMTINQATGQHKDFKRSDMYQLSKSTKDRIRIAIQPYNQKLGDLLGDEWGNKWQ